jgi:hypothetical protein
MLILFVLDRQFVFGECVITSSELAIELDITPAELKKITKSLNEKSFFKSGGNKLPNGSYAKGYGYSSFRTSGKRITVNEILLDSFLDNTEHPIVKIQTKHG